MRKSIFKQLFVASVWLCVSVSSVSAESIDTTSVIPSDSQHLEVNGVASNSMKTESLWNHSSLLGDLAELENPEDTENQEDIEVEVNNYVPTVIKTSLVNGKFSWKLKSDIVGKVNGVEYRVINKKTGNVISRGVSYSTVHDAIVDKADVVYVILRSFYYSKSGTTLYSDWSSAEDNHAYALRHVSVKIKDTKKTLHRHSVTLKWNKIPSAKNYTIYGKQRPGKKWYKLKTTKNNFLKVTKINKKTIDTVKIVEFKIVANTSVNGKILSSAPFLCTVYLRM